MIELLAAGVLTISPPELNAAGTCVYACPFAGYVTVDKPPCPKPLPYLDQSCTAWSVRVHYHLKHPMPWPREGEVCDPTKSAPEGYRCADDDEGKPPLGLTW